MLHPFSLVRHGRRLILLLPILLLAACSGNNAMPGGSLPPPDTIIQSQKKPPPLLEELIPPPPKGPPDQFTWDFGHWHWDGQDYIWIPGHYVERPYRSSHWVRGNWAYDGNLNWTWTPGYWQ